MSTAAVVQIPADIIEALGRANSVDEIKSIVANVSVLPPDGAHRTTLLYSGSLGGGLQAWQAAGAIGGEFDQIWTIDKTLGKAVLGSEALQTAITRVVGPDQAAIDRVFNGVTSNGQRTTLGLWDIVSQNIASSASGEVRTITNHTLDKASVFSQSELPALLANPNVTSIDGIPREALVALRDSKGIDAVRGAVAAQSSVYTASLEFHITRDATGNILKIDGVGTQKFFTPEFGGGIVGSSLLPSMAEKIVPSTLFGPMAPHQAELWRQGQNGVQFMMDFMREHNLTSKLEKLGTVAAVIGMTLAGYEAYAAYEAGDIGKARSIIMKEAAGFVGGLAAGIAAAQGAAVLTAPLVAGGPIGVAVAGVITFAAGIAGGMFGDQIARYMVDAGADIASRLFSGGLVDPRNPNILNVQTDTRGLNPTNSVDLGSVSGGQGLLVNGTAHIATMNAQYVNQGGFSNVSPSNIVAGGTRPGNGSLNDYAAQMAALRSQVFNGQKSLTETNTALTFYSSTPGGVYTSLQYGSVTFKGVVLLDSQGQIYAFQPDPGQSGSLKLADGTMVRMDGSKTILVGASVLENGLIRSYGFTVEDPSDGTLRIVASAKKAGYTDPVVLDRGNDGVVLGAVPVSFDLNADGTSEHVSWTAPTDPLLVMDVNGDGRINNGSELFSLTGAEGQFNLRSLDTNGDGKLDAADEKWRELRVWIDRNQDAYASAGELTNLTDLGIASIDLTPVYGSVAGQSNVKGLVATYTDGSHRTLWDVNMQPSGGTSTTTSTVYAPQIEKVTSGTQVALVAKSALGVTIDLNGSGASQATGQAGADRLIGTGGDDWLIGGAGADTFAAGAGNDLLVIDASDLQSSIDAGAGIDTVLVADDRGITLNLAQANVEVVYGGYGNDVFVGGGADNYFIEGAAGDDLIIGGSADDALSGQDGNDVILGNDGDDLVRGGRGDDQLAGGIGNDVIDGGLDNDTIDGGAGDDVFIASGGDDTIDGGDGVDLLQLSGELSDYHFVRNSDGSYKITDLVEGRDGTELIRNVEKFSFKSGTTSTALDLGLDQPLPVDDRIAISTNGSVTISAASLLANDIDFQHLSAPQLLLSWVGDAVGGSVFLSPDGQSVTFVPASGHSGPVEFSYRIKDEQGHAAPIIANVSDPSLQGEMKARVLLVPSDAPSDPGYAKQWYLGAVGAPEAWQAGYTGKGVRVLVLEPGGQFALDRQVADLNHQDLIANKSVSFQDTSVHSAHATEVAGVIGAARNGVGSVGVAYDATLDSRSFLPNSNPGATVAAFRADLNTMRNYDIVNNSWTQSNPDQFGWIGSLVSGDAAIMLQTAAEFDAQKDAATYGRSGLGTVMVYAAGNDRAKGYDAGLSTLTNNEFTITVGGVNLIGNVAGSTQPARPFSNRGANILVSAPASNIVTTGISVETPDGTTLGNDLTETQGTSLAAPIISGVVALMLEANPRLNYRDVQTILALTATRDLGTGTAAATTWATNHSANWNGVGMHYSADFGFGMVDAAAAVRMAETWVSEGGAPTYSGSVTAVASAVPDAMSPSAAGQQVLSFQVTEHMQVEQTLLRLTLDHARWSDLVVTLVSPSGTRSVLLDRPEAAVNASNPLGVVTFDVNLMSVHFRGEDVSGIWQLIVEDKVPGASGLGNVKASLQVVGTSIDDVKRFILTDEYAGGWNIESTTGLSELNAAAVSGSVRIDLSGTTSSNVNGKTLTVSSGIDRLIGSSGNDVLTGSVGAETIVGGRGDDVIDGGDGKDRLEGGLGHDTLLGGGGNDILVAGEGDLLTGGAGADTFIVEDDAAGATTVRDFKAEDYLVIRTKERISAADLTQTIEAGGLKLSYRTESGLHSIILEGVSAQLTPAQWGWMSEAGELSVNPESGAVTNKNVIYVSALPVVTRKGNAPYTDSNGFFVTDGGVYFTGTVSGGSIHYGSGSSTQYNPSVFHERLADGSIKDWYQIGEDFFSPEELALLYDVKSVSWGPQGTAGDDLMLVGGAVGPAPIGLQVDWAKALAGSRRYFNGYGGNDEIIGNDDAEDLNGGSGDDVLVANGGDDLLNGESGDDALDGGSGNDILYGGDGDDVLYAGAGDDVINGGAGDDTLFGGAGFDRLNGNDGSDVLSGNGYLYGGSGDDTLSGSGVLDGEAGDDVITSSGGYVFGGAGADRFLFTTGSVPSIVNDLESRDTVDFRGADTSAATASAIFASDDQNSFKASLTVKKGNGIEVVFTLPFNYSVDQILTQDLDLIPANFLFDSAERPSLIVTGRDITNAADIIVQEKFGLTNINTLAGDDIIFARTRNGLSIDAGEGKDLIYVLEGGNTVSGGFGDDRIQVLNGAVTVALDTLVGGAGNDIINAGAHGSLMYGDDAANSVSGNDVLIGGVGIDRIYGGGGDDTLDGNDGDDVLQGDGGRDTLRGGAGNDTLSGGAEDDSVDGGIGDDFLSGGDGADTILGGSGNDDLYGDGGNDVLNGGAGDDDIWGGAGDDALSGGTGNNILYGDDGADSLIGGEYNDQLYGGAGNDTLIGKDGVNLYVGGAGDDVIIARSGVDTVLVDSSSGRDTVWALSAVDTIKFSNVNSNEVSFNLHHGVTGTITWGHLGANSITLKDFSDDAQVTFADGVTRRLRDYEPNDGVVPTDFGWVAVYDTGVIGDRTQLGLYAGTLYDDHLYGGPILPSEPAYWYVVGREGNDNLAGSTSGAVLDGGPGDDKYLAGNGIVVIRGSYQQLGQDTIVMPAGITPETLICYRIPNPLRPDGYPEFSSPGGRATDLEYFLQQGDNPFRWLFGAPNSSARSFDTLRIQSLDGKLTMDIVGYFADGAARNNVANVAFSSQLDDQNKPMTISLGQLASDRGQTTVIRGGVPTLTVLADAFNVSGSIIMGSESGSYIEGRVVYSVGKMNGAYGYLYSDPQRNIRAQISQTSATAYSASNFIGLWDAQYIAASVGPVYLDAVGLSDMLLGSGGNDTLWGGGAFIDRTVFNGSGQTGSNYQRDTSIDPTYWSLSIYGLSPTPLLRDYLNGGDGDDTYIYRKGDGGLTIIGLPDSPYAGAGGVDTLVMRGYLSTDVTITTSSAKIVIRGKTTAWDAADVIIEFGKDGQRQVDWIQFDDKTVRVLAGSGTSPFPIEPTEIALDVVRPLADGIDERHIVLGTIGADTLVVENNSVAIGKEGADIYKVDLQDLKFAVIQMDRGDRVITSAAFGNEAAGADLAYFLTLDIRWSNIFGLSRSIGYLNEQRVRDGKYSIDDWVSVSATSDKAMDILLTWQMRDSAGIVTTHNLVLADVMTSWGTYLDPLFEKYLRSPPGGQESPSYGVMGNDVLYGWRLQTGDPANVAVYGRGGDDSISAAEFSSAGAVDANIRDYFYGGGGNDTLNGGTGDDMLDGGEGDDVLYGGGGNDTLIGGHGRDKMYGQDGDDLYVINADDDPSEVVEGLFAGSDTIQSSFNIDLRAYSNVENGRLTGGDVLQLTGTNDANTLTGNGVGSRLVGLSGDDVYVVTGPDIVVEAVDGGNDTIRTSIGILQLAANVENLVSEGASLILVGNELNNNIIGDRGQNIIYGLGGDDNLHGGDGADRLDGGVGNDTINGGAGNDTIVGGAGNDTLVGGSGADTFIFQRGDGKDVILNGYGPFQRSGELVFGADISSEQLWFSRVGNDLLIQIIGGGDQVTVSGWFGTQRRLEKIVAGDGVSFLDVGASIGAMAEYRSAHPGFDPGTSAALPDDAGIRHARLSDRQSAISYTSREIAIDATGNVVATRWALSAAGVLEASDAIVLGKAQEGWRIVGVADVNADGASDIIFATSIGFSLWRTGADGYTRDDGALSGLGPNVSYVGAGDLDGDGAAELVFRGSDTMKVAYGGSMADARSFSAPQSAFSADPAQPPVWFPVGVGNFNADGRADVVIMSNFSNRGVAQLHENLGVTDLSDLPRRFSTGNYRHELRSQLFADLDGDGIDEIITEERDNYTGMRNLRLADGTLLGTISSGATFGGVGDYDGDGREDLRWVTPYEAVKQFIWSAGQQSNTIAFAVPQVGSTSNVGLVSSAVPNSVGGGNDVIYGKSGNDVIDGGAGNDILAGRGGNDTYLFGRNGGHDIIVNGLPANTTSSGTLKFLQDITPENLWFSQSGQDLLIEMMGADDDVTVTGWFASPSKTLSQISTVSGWVIDGQVSQLVQAMASYSSSHSGFNTQTGGPQVPTDPSLQAAIAAAWHQTAA